MYKYLIGFVLITPLIGIWLVEGGEYAGSIGVEGYPNGAGVAFALYAIAVVAVALVYSGRGHRQTEMPVPGKRANDLFRRFSNRLLTFQIAFLILFLFGFGAIGVWLGGIEKGEFRTSLGFFGAIPNMTSKIIVPALVAYATILYSRTSRTAALKLRLAATFLVAFAIGASWGFKTTAISSVLPAVLLLYWRVRPLALVTLGLAFVGSIIAFFWIFDADVEVGADIQTLLLRRITVLQGDVAWHIWNQYSAGEAFPSYWPTLLAGVGDKVLIALGLSRADSYEWMLYHYDWMITYLAGAPLDVIEEGHSITATPFAEGLVAGGLGGLAAVTLIAGVLTGSMYRFLDRSLQKGRGVSAALGATYFCYYILPWLNAGAIVQLFHVSLLIGFGSTLVLLTIMRCRVILFDPVQARA
jgi:hypothetical protein